MSVEHVPALLTFAASRADDDEVVSRTLLLRSDVDTEAVVTVSRDAGLRLSDSAALAQSSPAEPETELNVVLRKGSGRKVRSYVCSQSDDARRLRKPFATTNESATLSRPSSKLVALFQPVVSLEQLDNVTSTESDQSPAPQTGAGVCLEHAERPRPLQGRVCDRAATRSTRPAMRGARRAWDAKRTCACTTARQCRLQGRRRASSGAGRRPGSGRHLDGCSQRARRSAKRGSCGAPTLKRALTRRRAGRRQRVRGQRHRWRRCCAGRAQRGLCSSDRQHDPR